LRNEFTLSANSVSQVRDYYNVRLGPVAGMLQYIGALAALVHLIFGTAMFSSLLYIGNADVIPIISRFMAAAIVSQVILQFEIVGVIKMSEEQGVWSGIMQPPLHGVKCPESEDCGEGGRVEEVPFCDDQNICRA
jgi:hypothetical protein